MTTSQGSTALVTGRLVFVIGDLFSGDVAKIYGTQTPKTNKSGQQYKEYGFGLAVPKVWFNNPQSDAGAFWNALYQFVAGQCGGQIPANFKMKWIDGDTGVTQEGVQAKNKEGYPGHIVFTMKSTIPPKFFRADALPNGERVYTQISEGIKNGYWVRVQVSLDINKGANASVYINPQSVEFVGVDKEIINTPSGAQIFGGAPAAMLPPGVQAPNTAPTGFAPPGAPQQAQPTAAAPYQAPATATPPTPNWGVLPAAHQPPGAPQQAQPTAAAPYQAPVSNFSPPPMPTFGPR